MNKLIRAQAQVVLPIAAVIVSWAPVAQGQSARPSDSAEITLSGESLRSIESRTTSSDYQRSFETLSPRGLDVSTDLSRSREEENKLRIDERTEVVVSDISDSGDRLRLFRVPGDVRDSKKVQIQFQLGD